MGINHKPQLSPKVYAILKSFVEFKADFHHVFIRVRKDLVKTWHNILHLAINDVIFIVLESWPSEWRALAGSTMEMDKSVAQRKKGETKLRMVQLVEKLLDDEENHLGMVVMWQLEQV